MISNKKRQKQLDELKWAKSMEHHENMAGKMDYCNYCPKQLNFQCAVEQKDIENGNLCAKAFNKMKKAK